MTTLIKSKSLLALVLALVAGVSGSFASTSLRVKTHQDKNLGIEYKSLSAEGDAIGVKIAWVVEGSAADVMGLRENDVFLGIDDQPITLQSIKQLADLYTPGEEVLLRLERGRRYIQVSAKMPNLEDKNSGPAFLGVESTSIGKADVVGVALEKVIRGSAADYAGLKKGDIVLGVNNKPVVDGDLGALIERHQAGDTVQVRVERGNKQVVVSVILGAAIKNKAV